MKGSLSTKHFRIALNAQIGHINEKKADKLAQIFADEFQMKMLQGTDQPNISVFVLANPEKKEALILEPAKIIYQLEAVDEFQPDFEKIKRNLRLLFDSLFLDDYVSGLIHLVGHINSSTSDAMAESIEKFTSNQQEMHELIPNVKGLGLRFLLEHHTGVWEYKLEPFINDPRFFYTEMICNINKNTEITHIVDIAHEAFVDFVDKKQAVLNKFGIS